MVRNGTKTPTESEDASVYEWEYAKPIYHLSLSERRKLFFYNPMNGKIMGRTPKGWGQILFFYFCFYAVLAAVFAICLNGLLSTISREYPVYTLDKSLIGSNPGMGFRPMADNIDEGSIIRYVASDPKSVQFWVKHIDDFLLDYEDAQNYKGTHRQICDYDRPPSKGKSCAVDLSSVAMGPCTKKNQYGYHSHSPCIFLKLNRIYDWMPEYFNDTDNLPELMPDTLQNFINTTAKEKNMLNTIWVSCHGEDGVDNENLGPVEYYPQPGFPGYFYPYRNSKGYLSPLVAVHLIRPKLNQMIKIECKLWAKNIRYARTPLGREGSVLFEILID